MWISVKKRYVLILILFIAIFSIFFLFLRKPPEIHEVIEQAVSENDENVIDDPLEDKDLNESLENENRTEGEEEVSVEVDRFFDLMNTFEQMVNFFTKRDYYIVAIGDSLTQGVGDETKNGGYVGILENMINRKGEFVVFDNFGKAGSRTDQLLNRLEEEDILQAIDDADMILITIGANDIMKVARENFMNLSYDLFIHERLQYENRLIQILEEIRQKNDEAHIYLLGIYNPFDRFFGEIEELNHIVNDWNQTSERTTDRFEQTTFIPIRDLFENSSEDLFSEDNFHPNYKGYRKIASRVLDYLTR